MAMGVAAIKGDGLAGRQSQEMGGIDQYGIRVISRPKKKKTLKIPRPGSVSRPSHVCPEGGSDDGVCVCEWMGKSWGSVYLSPASVGLGRDLSQQRLAPWVRRRRSTMVILGKMISILSLFLFPLFDGTILCPPVYRDIEPRKERKRETIRPN